MSSALRRFWMIVMVVCGLGLLGSLAACHTVEGAGRDVSAAGQGVSSLAEEARPYD